MAVREVIQEGDERLRKICKPVKHFNKDLAELLDDMYQTMVLKNGVGIASPQVGILLRAFVIDIEGLKMEFINPEITEASGSCVLPEGCLSVPNRSGNVERPTHIVVKAFTREGTPFEMVANDYVARVICHENDHLNGILYIDKLTKKKKSEN